MRTNATKSKSMKSDLSKIGFLIVLLDLLMKIVRFKRLDESQVKIMWAIRLTVGISHRSNTREKLPKKYCSHDGSMGLVCMVVNQPCHVGKYIPFDLMGNRVVSVEPLH